MKRKKTLLIILGGGGHTSQMIRLTEQIELFISGLEGPKKKYQYEYVVAKEDTLSEGKIKIKGSVFRLLNPRRMHDKSMLKVILRFIPSTLEAIGVLARSKADTVIACGPGLCVHVCFLAKLFGKKVIFLESWSRAYNKSLSGRHVYKFADMFFVQWPHMVKQYPKAVYAGRLG